MNSVSVKRQREAEDDVPRVPAKKIKPSVEKTVEEKEEEIPVVEVEQQAASEEEGAVIDAQAKRRRRRKAKPDYYKFLRKNVLRREFLANTAKSLAERFKAEGEVPNPSQAYQYVLLGQSIIAQAQVLKSERNRNLVHLNAQVCFIQATYGLDNAGIDTSAMISNVKERLDQLSGFFLRVSEPTMLDEVTFILCSWAQCLIMDKMLVNGQRERPRDLSLLRLAIRSEISWNVANSMSKQKTGPFFENIRRKVGYDLERYSSVKRVTGFLHAAMGEARYLE